VVGSIDHRSDVYSLGCIMYELLSGRKVFETNSPWYCIYQKIEEIPDSLNKIIDISDGLNDIVMKCLEKDPDNRYQTAAEVAFDLGMVGI